MNYFIPILIGLAAGTGSGLFGIGGGVIIVPLVLYFYKYTQQTATATSLIALLLPVGSFAIWHYYKSGFIDASNLKIGLGIAFGMLLGALVGAKIATTLSNDTLSKMFSVFLVIVAIKLWFSK